jgi:hypothetical protein
MLAIIIAPLGLEVDAEPIGEGVFYREFELSLGGVRNKADWKPFSLL